jgi:hypothetical protein
MSSLRSFEELYRRALDLNLRYYASVGKLTADYFRELYSTVGNLQTNPTTPPPPGSYTAAPPRPAEAPRGGVPAVMVFEGDAGSTALGVFLIGNSLDHEVSAPITASPIVDEAGKAVNITFSFDPAVVNLRPGEQLLVRATAVIDPALEIGVRHRGEFLIPELLGTRIPFVVRRRHTGSESLG